MKPNDSRIDAFDRDRGTFAPDVSSGTETAMPTAEPPGALARQRDDMARAKSGAAARAAA